MGFYDDKKNVEQYMDMAQGYDGRELILRLSGNLSPGSTVLEIGSGPGIDLDILLETYKATGSDLSLIFRDLYLSRHPEADWLTLDAVTLDTDRCFDAIYSNKVLHHLSEEQMTQSLKNQKKILLPGGLLLHSFWKGSQVEEMMGMVFHYYQKEDLQAFFEKEFKIEEIGSYTEMEEDDSLFIMARSLD